MIIRIASQAETEAFGRRLGERLFPGAIVALDGPLGAGKTHLVRAIAEGLQIENPDLVTSPTFVLIQEYPARMPIYHFDAYRLKSEAEFRDLGSDEYLCGDGVCLIEWAERISDALPVEKLHIVIERTGETERIFHVHWYGPRYDAVMAQGHWVGNPSAQSS